jgi:hypothetical protein
MVNVTSEGHDYAILFAEGHSTTEIFCEKTNRWIWIDPALYVLGARLGEQGPINAAELHRYLNDPERSGDLQVLGYDPEGEETWEPLPESGKRDELLNYFKREQKLYYRSF